VWLPNQRLQLSKDAAGAALPKAAVRCRFNFSFPGRAWELPPFVAAAAELAGDALRS